MGGRDSGAWAPWRRAAAAAAVSLGFAVSCGSVGLRGGPSATLADGRSADPTLRWRDFPVGASPRPVVFLDGPVAEPVDGYTTDDAKVAVLTGLLDPPAAFPASPGQVDGRPIVDASAAFVELTAPANGAKADGSVRPLTVGGVRLGSATFRTDRGPSELPAWLFDVPGATAAVAVAALAPPAVFVPTKPPPDRAFSGAPAVTGATVDGTGRSVMVSFVGAKEGTGACTADYDVAIDETTTVVLIEVRTRREGGGSCKALGYLRQAVATLAAPLGNRVLVDVSTDAVVGVVAG